MMSDDFALEKFKKLYAQMFVDVKLHKGAAGGTEIVAYYNKSHFKRDWVPEQFCRRPVRCVRLKDPQPATKTPMPSPSQAASA